MFRSQQIRNRQPPALPPKLHKTHNNRDNPLPKTNRSPISVPLPHFHHSFHKISIALPAFLSLIVEGQSGTQR